MRPRKTHRRPRRSFRLHLEALEDRRLLTTYAITDLGTNLNPIALNNNGDVAAETTNSSRQTAGVLIKANGTVIDLTGLIAVGGLNDSDQVVGANGTQGLLWNNGTVTPVPVEPAVVLQMNGIAISDNGIIVGGPDEAVVDANGTVTALTPPPTLSEANTISSNGQFAGGSMIGSGESEAAMWNLATGQGTFVDGGGGSLGQTLGVNNSGDAVGVYDQDIGGSAFLYSNGKFMDLGQGNNSSANAINDQGVVVGMTGTGAAFIYSNGVATNLQQEVPSSPGFTLTYPVGINDKGQILTMATDAAGNQHALLLTPAASTSMTLSGFPSSTTAGEAGQVTVTILNPDGSVDTGYTGTVHFTSSDPQASLPANYTFTAADAGVHTFSVTLKTSGAQSFTVTDTKTNTLFASDQVTVNPGAATHFALLVGSNSTPAGEQFYILVEALDAFGNIATGFTGTVHFSSSDRRASLPANFTFQAGVGEVYFPVTLRTLGKQTITVTDTQNAAIAGSVTMNVVRYR